MSDHSDAGAAREASGIKVSVDGLNERFELVGWACVIDLPKERVNITLLLDGVEIGACQANLPRPDVGRAGFGDGRSGFALTLPKALFVGERRTFWLHAEALHRRPLVEQFVLDLPVIPQVGDRPVWAAPAPLSSGGARGAAAIYVPGYRIVSRLPHPRPVYHTSGWHEPQANLTWIAGAEAFIEMLIRRPLNHYHLMLDVIPNIVAARSQALEVFLNGYRLAYADLPARTALTIELPSELFVRRTTELRLLCEAPTAAAKLSIVDMRHPRVGLREWCIA